MQYFVLLIVDHADFCWFLGMVRIFPVGCRCVLVYLGRWPSALCFAWWSPASDRMPSGAVYICRRVYLSVGCVLYVFGESWNGVGLGVRWVLCTVNCGGTHYYTILMFILLITVYCRVMPSVVRAVELNLYSPYTASCRGHGKLQLSCIPWIFSWSYLSSPSFYSVFQKHKNISYLGQKWRSFLKVKSRIFRLLSTLSNVFKFHEI